MSPSLFPPSSLSCLLSIKTVAASIMLFTSNIFEEHSTSIFLYSFKKRLLIFYTKTDWARELSWDQVWKYVLICPLYVIICSSLSIFFGTQMNGLLLVSRMWHVWQSLSIFRLSWHKFRFLECAKKWHVRSNLQFPSFFFHSMSDIRTDWNSNNALWFSIVFAHRSLGKLILMPCVTLSRYSPQRIDRWTLNCRFHLG